jgi:hypothetical protein
MRILVHCERIFIPNALSALSCALDHDSTKAKALSQLRVAQGPDPLCFCLAKRSRFLLQSSANVGARLDSCWPWKR